jgi:hypothetical protein
MLWGSRDSLTIEEITALEIPAEDRLWVAIYTLPVDRLVMLARRYANDQPGCADAGRWAKQAADHASASATYYAAAYAARSARDFSAALERYLVWAVEAHREADHE